MNISDCKKYEPIFNSWYIKSVLGQGSFGTVFEIQKEEFGKTYNAALKVISIPYSEDEIERMRIDGTAEDSIRRYYDAVVKDIIGELDIMSELKGNSNIVSYEDHAVIKHPNDIGYDILIKMELLTPLMKYRAEHGLTEQDVIRLGIDICSGLELCDRSNIIHRDIKPENIFVAKSGNFKLGDFGISRTIEKTSSELSRKGTYSYMAPEVYRGWSYGKTVDLCSLGIVMYAMLNGTRIPFLPPLPAEITHNDKEKAINRRMAGEQIPAIDGVDSRLMDVIFKACAFDVGKRYSSASEMRRELELVQKQLGSAEPSLVSVPSSDPAEDLTQDLTEDPTAFLPAEEAIFDTGAAETDNRSQDYPDYTFEPSGNSGENEPPGGSGRKKSKGLFIVLGIALAAILAICGVMIMKNQDPSQSAGEETAVKEAAAIDPGHLDIEAWDMDFSNSTNRNKDDTVSYNTVLLVNNNSDEAITGIAYKVKNRNGKIAKNMDAKYGINDPFYAEGYVPSGKKGIMISKVTVSEDEYDKELKERPYPSQAVIDEGYVFKGEKGYQVPKGRLFGEDCVGEDENGNKLYNYNVSVSNKNDTPIHKGSKIAAAYIKYNEESGHDTIMVSSAKGEIPREIAAKTDDDIAYGMQGTEFGRKEYKKDKRTGDPIRIEDYYVCVIDSQYSDGSHYRDRYEEEYGQQ